MELKEYSNKLNSYLNDICSYLSKEHPFIMDNIEYICYINDNFCNNIKNINLDNNTKENDLSFEDVYNLAREIIKNIDKNYLDSYDKLIPSGELDFSYNNDYIDSSCTVCLQNDEVIGKYININRNFNYEDVTTLVHEFIHYTNFKSINYNREALTEFLSIYFEMYGYDYLLDNGINSEYLDL